MTRSPFKVQRSKVRRRLAAAMMAGALTPALAQEPGPAEETELEEVVVTSPTGQGAGWLGAPDWVYTTPGSTSVVSADAINQVPARNTGDLVESVPGVWAQTARQDPGISPNIRGLQDFGRVNVSLDGARQNFQQSGHGANGAAYIDSALVREVEVDKGPTSEAGGAGVIGGVVAFRTLEASDLIEDGRRTGARFDASTGTNAYDFVSSLAGAATAGSLEVVGAVSRRDLGEYEPGRDGELLYLPDVAPLRFTEQDSWSGLFKTTLRPSEDQSLKLGWVGSDNAFGTGEAGLTNENRVRANTLTAAYTFDPDTALVDLRANLWRASTENRQFRPARVSYGAYDVSYSTVTTGGDLSNTARATLGPAGLALTHGVEFFLDRGKTDAIALGGDPDYWLSGPTPGGARDVGSVFGDAKLALGGFEAIAGLRYDAFRLEGDTALPDGQGSFTGTSASLSGGALLPKLTLAYAFENGVQVYATRAQGFRPPTTTEALMYGEHIGGGVLFQPNPDLEPERSTTYEAGVNILRDDVLLDGDALRAKVSVYDTRVDDFIGQLSQGFRSVVYENVDEARFRGFEVEASYDAGRVFVGASVTRVVSEFSDALVPEGMEGGLLFTPPEHKVTATAGVRFLDETLTVGARVLNVAERDAPAGFGAAWDAFTRVDAFGVYAPTDRLTLRAGVENLFDTAYVDPIGNPLYPAPGRTATLDLSVTF